MYLRDKHCALIGVFWMRTKPDVVVREGFFSEYSGTKADRLYVYRFFSSQGNVQVFAKTLQEMVNVFAIVRRIVAARRTMYIPRCTVWAWLPNFKEGATKFLCAIGSKMMCIYNINSSGMVSYRAALPLALPHAEAAGSCRAGVLNFLMDRAILRNLELPRSRHSNFFFTCNCVNQNDRHANLLQAIVVGFQ